jgi:DNA-binding MarR family transcriptional regulator
MKRFTVNEQQLELIGDIKLYGILSRFDEPRTPSEVAKRLRLPANTIHYHVKRLVAAKLLTCVAKNGRQCKYQRVSDKFRFHESLLPTYEKEFPESLAQELKKINRHFLNQCEKMQPSDFPRDEANPSYLLLDFHDFEDMEAERTVAMTLGVTLTKKQHAKFVKVLENLFAEIKDNVSPGEDYTFCFLTCPGRAT